jgi:hypothetical protein
MEDNVYNKFMELYHAGSTMVQSDPDMALMCLLEAQHLAPELCDETFQQWMSYVQYFQQQAYPTAEGLASAGDFSHDTPISGVSSNQGAFPVPISSQAVETGIADWEEDEVSILLSGVKDLLSEEEYKGAMDLLECLIAQEPHSHQIQELYHATLDLLEHSYRDLFENPEQVIPRLLCSPEHLIKEKQKLHYHVGFLLSLIDGFTSVADLIIVSGLDEREVLRSIGRLHDKGFIALGP